MASKGIVSYRLRVWNEAIENGHDVDVILREIEKQVNVWKAEKKGEK